MREFIARNTRLWLMLLFTLPVMYEWVNYQPVNEGLILISGISIGLYLGWLLPKAAAEDRQYEPVGAVYIPGTDTGEGL